MSIRTFSVFALAGALLIAGRARGLEPDELQGFERTPPRLASTEGPVSFWRPGAEAWAPGLANTALAAGDELYTGDDANLEVQVGPRAFVRADESTQLGITTLEPDYLQLRVTQGRISLDLRSVKTGQTFEIDTPNAAFSVERTGTYRVEVDGETTTFTTRRGGNASVVPAQGEPAAIAPSEQVVVTGSDAPQLETYAAPELDDWDRWNYARTDRQLDAVSARYVPAGVYGVDDLDHYGDWRVVPSYGAVWMPRTVAVGWAPYSTGRWVYDPFYGWTWVDDAPWGWAPFHYGRWVHVSGRWGWCPGPVVARAVYAPALVAFYGGGVTLGVVGRAQIGWVALGWGEPLFPWWGSVAFRRQPHWAGWSGPRVVNDVVVTHTTVVHVNEIRVYRNARVHDAVVVVDRDRFGRRGRGEGRFARAPSRGFSPVHGDLELPPDRTSVVAARGRAVGPPRGVLERRVVATRTPRPDPMPGLREAAHGEKRHAGAAPKDLPSASPPARVVEAPRQGRRIRVSERPPFGREGASERRIAPPAPPFREAKQEARRQAEAKQEARRQAEAKQEAKGHGAPPRAASGPEPVDDAATRSAEPRRGRRTREDADASKPPTTPAAPERHGHAAPARGRGAEPAPAPGLPGEPANRVYRDRGRSRGGSQGHGGEAATGAPAPASPRQRDAPAASHRSRGGDASASSHRRARPGSAGDATP